MTYNSKLRCIDTTRSRRLHYSYSFYWQKLRSPDSRFASRDMWSATECKINGSRLEHHAAHTNPNCRRSSEGSQVEMEPWWHPEWSVGHDDRGPTTQNGGPVGLVSDGGINLNFFFKNWTQVKQGPLPSYMRCIGK